MWKEKERKKEKDRQRERDRKEREERERQTISATIEELEPQDRSNQFEKHISHFDVAKHIRLVPPFQEKEVDKYFMHF